MVVMPSLCARRRTGTIRISPHQRLGYPLESRPTVVRMETVVLSGLSALRWAAWVWMAIGLAVSWDDLRSPVLALALVGAALASTVAASVRLRHSPETLLRPTLVGTE